MVLSERNTNTDALRNGRRSRGPSPNSPASTDSDSEEEVGMSPIANSYAGEKIRVGRDYQAGVPDFIPLADRRLDQCPEKALLVWSPTIDISDTKVDEYISLAKEKYSYNGEQALGMLFWHKHDLERAILDLANFTPFPDEWTVEDKVLFEQAFQFHGKSFHRIRQMLPDKPIAILVKYYYTWKKTRMRTSVMDKLARKMANRAAGAGDDGQGSDNASDFGSNTDSDSDEKKWPWIHRGIRRKSGSPPRIMPEEVIKKEKGAEGSGDVKSSCANCGVACTQAQATPKGAVCNTCFTHWRRTGNARPITGPLRPPRERLTHSMLMRQKRKPPRGMYINHDDLVAIASGTGQGEEMLRGMDREIVSLKRQVQNNKQRLSSVKRKTSHESECQRPQESTSRLNGRWTSDELLLAVQGMRQYGKDFLAIAEVIGTKSEAHLRTFYVNYRRRYNLDAVLTEYEAEHGPIVEDEKEVDENSRPEKGGPSPPIAPAPVTAPAPATIGNRQ